MVRSDDMDLVGDVIQNLASFLAVEVGSHSSVEILSIFFLLNRNSLLYF